MEQPKSLEELLKEIEAETPKVRTEKEGTNYTCIYATLPNSCRINGIIGERPEDVDLLVGTVTVPEAFQRHGIGSRLIEALIKGSAQFHPSAVRSRATTEGGLKTLLAVLGEENVTFHKVESFIPDHRPIASGPALKISKEEALALVGSGKPGVDLKAPFPKKLEANQRTG